MKLSSSAATLTCSTHASKKYCRNRLLLVSRDLVKPNAYLQDNPANADLVRHVKRPYFPIYGPIGVVQCRLLWPRVARRDVEKRNKRKGKGLRSRVVSWSATASAGAAKWPQAPHRMGQSRCICDSVGPKYLVSMHTKGIREPRMVLLWNGHLKIDRGGISKNGYSHNCPCKS